MRNFLDCCLPVFFLLKEYRTSEAFSVSKTPGEMDTHGGLLEGGDLAAAAEEKETHSFEVDPAQVLSFLNIKRQFGFIVY